MSRGRIITAVVVLLVVVAGAAALVFGSQARRPVVTTATASQETLAVVVSASGKVEANVKADVYPGVAQATIKEVLVKDGQSVKAGDVLATLDEEALEAQADAARGTYNAAIAQADAASAAAPTAADREAAVAAVNAAQTAYDFQVRLFKQRKKAYEDLKKAFENGVPGVTKAQVIAAKNAMLAQKVQVDSAFSALQQAKAGLAKVDSGIAAAAANRRAALGQADAAAAQLRQVQIGLDDVEMEAPISGTVIFNPVGAGGAAAAAAGAAGAGSTGATLVSEGAAVTSASPPFTVVQLNSMFFTAEVDETDIARVKPGMTAEISLDAFPEKTFESKVVKVRPAALVTATGGTAFPVQVSLKGVDASLKLGMGGNADIQVSGVEGAVTVPIEAIFDEEGDSYVYVVVNDVLDRRKVTLGASTDTEAQILEGVESGDVVALSGPVKFKDGLAVKTQ